MTWHAAVELEQLLHVHGTTFGSICYTTDTHPMCKITPARVRGVRYLPLVDPGRSWRAANTCCAISAARPFILEFPAFFFALTPRRLGR